VLLHLLVMLADALAAGFDACALEVLARILLEHGAPCNLGEIAVGACCICQFAERAFVVPHLRGQLT